MLVLPDLTTAITRSAPPGVETNSATPAQTLFGIEGVEIVGGHRHGESSLIELSMLGKLEVEPELLAEIEYRAKSAEGKVRHPFFKGIREDL